MFWMRKVEGFKGGFNIKFLQEASIAFVRSFSANDDEGANSSKPMVSRRWVNGALGASLLLSLMGFALWRIHALRESLAKQYPLTSDQQRAVRLYRRLRRRLEREGVDCACKTAEELRATLEGGEFVDPLIAVQALETYNAVRFGLRPMGEGEYGRLMKGLRSLRAESN